MQETDNGLLEFIDPPERSSPLEEVKNFPPAPVENLEMQKTPAVPETPLFASQESAIPQIPITKTFYKDLGQEMDKNDIGTMTSVIRQAHEEEEIKQEISPKNPKNKILVALSVFLIIAGVAAAGFAIYRTLGVQAEKHAIEITSLVRAEAHAPVFFEDNSIYKNRAAFLAELVKPVPEKTIKHIYFAKNNLTGMTPLTLFQALQEMDTPLPDMFVAHLNQNAMYGVYEEGMPHPFLLLTLPTINDYDGTFQGMRDLEPTFITRYGYLFGIPQAEIENLARLPFEDIIMGNKNFRALIFHPAPREATAIPAPIAPPEFPPVAPKTTTSETAAPSESQTSSEQTPAPATEINMVIPPAPEIPVISISQSIYRDGNIVILYTFLSEKSVLITTSDTTVDEIIKRLTNTQIIP